MTYFVTYEQNGIMFPLLSRAFSAEDKNAAREQFSYLSDLANMSGNLSRFFGHGSVVRATCVKPGSTRPVFRRTIITF